MPHCVIEHSSDIDGAVLIAPVFDGALASDLFDTSGKDIKVRAVCFEHYQTGNQQRGFIHVTLKILSGRTDHQKRKLSQSVLENLSAYAQDNCSLTVEVSDIDRTSYAKVVT